MNELSACTRNPVATPAQVGLDPSRLGRIRRWMDDYVDSGRLPFMSVMIARRGRVAYFDWTGQADVGRGTPANGDTVARIYSMTKPITTVAALMLYEEGHFQLDDPVSAYIPALSGLEVLVGGTAESPQTVPSSRDFTIRELMTHTSGLTYGFLDASPVDAIYRREGLDFNASDDGLAAVTERLGSVPLLAQPGTEWNYSVSTDVLGRLVEVWSGMDFETFLRTRIFEPLDMPDTGFHCREENHSRFAANYRRNSKGVLAQIDPSQGSRFCSPAATFSGGGGLVSTAGDYMRFCRMMLGRGELDGERLIGRKAHELMTMNHLGGDMASMGQEHFSESTYVGIGFGLGVSVMLDPAGAQILGSPGEYAWGGAASTAFWIDPVEEQIVILLTQLMPSSLYTLRRELRVLSYQAIVD